MESIFVAVEKNTIQFKVTYRGHTYQAITREGEFASLMCLLSFHFPIRCFGICYGGGSCGTCGAEIRDETGASGKFSLTCEIPITDELANKTIHILR